MSRFEIRIAGFGGQGVLKAGAILGKALSLHRTKSVMQREYHVFEVESYGPATRGGVSKSDIVISDEPDDYPEIEKADLFIILSQQALDESLSDMKQNATVIVDSTIVESPVDRELKIYKIPATEMAKRIKLPILANLALLGAFTALTNFVRKDEMEKVIGEEFSNKAREINLEAFRAGYKYARKEYTRGTS